MQVMKSYFMDLKNVFRHYALGGTMSSNEMQTLVKDAKISDPVFQMGHVDVIYTTCSRASR